MGKIPQKGAITEMFNALAFKRGGSAAANAYLSVAAVGVGAAAATYAAPVAVALNIIASAIFAINTRNFSRDYDQKQQVRKQRPVRPQRPPGM